MWSKEPQQHGGRISAVEKKSPGSSLRCDAKKVHKEETNGSNVDSVVDATDSRPMSNDCCAEENYSKYNSNAHGKAKKRKRLSNNVEDDKCKGVSKRPSGRYSAEIKFPGSKRRLWLDTFDTAEEATRAYDAAKHANDKTVESSTKSKKRPGFKTKISHSGLKCQKKLHMKKPNDSGVDCKVDGTDPGPMSIVCCARENYTGDKADKIKLLWKDVEDDESMTTDCTFSSDNKHPNSPTSAECVGLPQLLSNFENFKIVVNGSAVDPELSHEIHRKYFDLCSKRRLVLHRLFPKSISAKLAAEIISETTKISESIKDCELKTCGDNLETWNRTLARFEMLGMDVFFIRARINRLLGLLWDSKKTEDRRIDCWFREEANESW